MTRMPAAGPIVRAGVARADRLRRSRDAGRWLWRAAPAITAMGVAVAAAGRWAEWRPAVPLAALAIGGAALAAYFLAARRDRHVSDATAAEIDAHAGLGGELRSAHWFEARDTNDPWIDLHLARAAARVDAVDWARLYPAVGAGRAKFASVLMALAAVALALWVPGRTGVHADGAGTAASARTKAVEPLTSLPADLQKELEDLLNAAETGTAVEGGRQLTAAELKKLLARIADLQALKAANDGKSPVPPGGTIEEMADHLKPLSERLKKASQMASLSPEVRDAFAEISEKIRDEADAKAATPKEAGDPMAAADAQAGDAAQSNKPGENDETAIQSVTDASAGAGAGVVMMSSQEASSGKEAGLGLGGSSQPNGGRGHLAELGAALKQETIEAATDNPGENVETALRRKTERGDATVTYTRSAPRAFDRGRSSAPPAVPEGRRAGVHSYFIRKP